MLTTLVEQFAANLATVGLTGTSDPRKLPVPGVLIYPAGLDFDRLDPDTATVDVEVILVAKGLGTPAALDQLEDSLGRVRQLWTVPAVEAVSVNLPNHSPDPLPGLRFTLTTQVTLSQE